MVQYYSTEMGRAINHGFVLSLVVMCAVGNAERRRAGARGDEHEIGVAVVAAGELDDLVAAGVGPQVILFRIVFFQHLFDETIAQFALVRIRKPCCSAGFPFRRWTVPLSVHGLAVPGGSRICSSPRMDEVCVEGQWEFPLVFFIFIPEQVCEI